MIARAEGPSVPRASRDSDGRCVDREPPRSGRQPPSSLLRQRLGDEGVGAQNTTANRVTAPSPGQFPVPGGYARGRNAATWGTPTAGLRERRSEARSRIVPLVTGERWPTDPARLVSPRRSFRSADRCGPSTRFKGSSRGPAEIPRRVAARQWRRSLMQE